MIYNESRNNTNEQYSETFYKAYAIKGILLYSLGRDANELLKWFDEAFENGIRDDETIFYYASTNYRVGNWKRASELYKMILFDNTGNALSFENNAASYYWCAQALYSPEEKYTDGIYEYLNKAIEYCSTESSYYQARGLYHIEKWELSNQTEEASIVAAIEDMNAITSSEKDENSACFSEIQDFSVVG